MQNISKPNSTNNSINSTNLKKVFKTIGLILLGMLVLIICGLGVLFLLTPDRFKFAKSDHFHFRFQYIYRGQAEDFGSPRYQVDYVKDICNGVITESPLHFHDNKDQIVHAHWQNMRGGDLLKFYGVNLVGGISGSMGVKFDELFKFPPKFVWLPTHSNSLPKATTEDQYYIYTGDKNNYVKKDLINFLNQSVEEFIGTNSKIRLDKEEAEKWQKKTSDKSINLLDTINVKAHEGEEHATLSEAEKHEQDVKKNAQEAKLIEDRNNQVITATSAQSNTANSTALTNSTAKTEEELKQINNLIGNVVIFVQKNEPTNEQIKARFNKLEPLGLSVCGG